MTSEFDALQKLIEVPDATVSFDTCYYLRFQNSLRTRNSPRDKAALTRSVLLHEAEKQGGTSPVLSVPIHLEWPDRTMWEEAGITVIAQTKADYMIQALPWQPAWLTDPSSASVERPLFAKEPRQGLPNVKGDPFLSMVQLSTYRCQGQADAIRSILTAPQGSTLVVNLPTGTGKSLCAHLPSLLASPSEGVSIIVVPTVALAIDQERAMAQFIPHPTAYYGGRDIENKAIRERILNGTQRVVFTSPESIMQSLNVSLQLAAERGYLRYLFIDEAHMIELWGDEFRPAFQELAGWRKHLMRLAPSLRTVLLSATITESSLDAMEDLFGNPGPFNHCSAVHLRPEPAYWFKRSSNEADKKKYIMEAIHLLPRPLILYTSRVDDAEEWGRELQQIGYGRLRVMTGKTPNRKREDIIKAWRKRDIDIVVATSAFGLGVDQPDVRVVIHACVPESLDRYYQEVGRGGRDGNASLSLVVYTDTDIHTAEEMSGKMLITIKRGIQRWGEMFRQKQTDPRYPDCYLMPINVSPSLDTKDIDMGGTNRNRAWNIRTLNLMSRSKLVEMDWQRWEGPDQGEDYLGHTHRLVRILNNDHLQEDEWEQVVEPYRQSSSRVSMKSLLLMKALLNGVRCVADVFKDVYDVPERGGEHPRKSIIVQTACGGCPYCRRVKQEPYVNAPSSHVVNWHEQPYITPLLSSRLDAARMATLLFDVWPERTFTRLSRREQEKWAYTLRYFIDHGMRQICAPEDLLHVLTTILPNLGEEPLFLNPIDSPSYRWLQVPTVIIHPCTDHIQKSVERFLCQESNQRPTIVLLPEPIRESMQPHRLVIDVLQRRKYRMSEFQLEVGL